MTTGMKWRGIGCPKCGCNATDVTGCECLFPAYGWSSGCHPVGGTDNLNPISSFTTNDNFFAGNIPQDDLPLSQSGASYWVTDPAKLAVADLSGPAIAIPVSGDNGPFTGTILLGVTENDGTGYTRPDYPSTPWYIMVLTNSDVTNRYTGVILEADQCDGAVTAKTITSCNPDGTHPFTTTWTANDWTSCFCVGNPPGGTGCCYYDDGEGVARVDNLVIDENGCWQSENGRVSDCSVLAGTWVPDANCPPIGCCTLPSGQTVSDTTLAGCEADGGTWTFGDCGALEPLGCCGIIDGPDLPSVTEALCTQRGGVWTEGLDCQGVGWCIDNSDGSVTPGIEENDCTGIWSSTEPTMGCCDISGTDHENVAQQWCAAQGGSFNAGDCSGFNPCSDTWGAVINDLSVLMDDPNFDLLNSFFLFGGTWTQNAQASMHDVCSTDGALNNATSVDVYGDNTGNPSQLDTTSYTTVKFDSGSSTWSVETNITWTYSGTNYVINLSKSGIVVPAAGCPSFTISGSYDTFSGNYQQTGNGNIFTVDNLTGSFNITLTCE